jgi:CBS-domain-containing membrane protein
MGTNAYQSLVVAELAAIAALLRLLPESMIDTPATILTSNRVAFVGLYALGITSRDLLRALWHLSFSHACLRT